MKKALRRKIHEQCAALMVGFYCGAKPAVASANGANFSDISQNIVKSIEDLPGLLSAIAYMIGLLLAVLGVLKLKDHVENPTNTPLKDGAIRLATGGALFALPVMTEAMQNTIGTASELVAPAKLNPVELGLQ